MTTTFNPGATIALDPSTPLSSDTVQASSSNTDIIIKGNGTGLISLTNSDETRAIKISPSGTSGTYLTLSSAQTTNKTITFPDIDGGSVVLTEGAQTINGTKTFGGDVAISGNFTVSGTTTYVNTTTLTVTDNFIIVNSGPAATRDGGALVQRFQSSNDTASGDVITDTAALSNIEILGSSSNTVILESIPTSDVDDFYKNWWILVTSGDGVNQVRQISTYNGTTHVATVSSAWTTNPGGTNPRVSLYSNNYTGIYYSSTSKRHVLAYAAREDVTTLSVQNYVGLDAANAAFKDTTNQLVLGTTNTVTINATAPSASRIITLADPGTNASFVVTEGAQTINGLKTFGTGVATTSISVTRATGTDAGSNLTITAGGGASGASNKAGGDLVLTPGTSTGTALSKVRIQGMTRASSTGTTDNTAVDRVIAGVVRNLSDGSLTDIAEFTCANQTAMGAVLNYTIYVSTANDVQSQSGSLFIAVINDATTVSYQIIEPTPAKVVSSGTLSVAWSMGSSISSAILSVNANTSLSSATMKICYTLFNNGDQAVSIN